MTTPRPISGGPASGAVELPPSKSLSNRYLNLALLAAGTTRIDRLLLSEDTEVFLGALRAVGRRVTVSGGDVLVKPGTKERRGEIDCGASGTMLRLLLASLVTEPGHWYLDGTPRLRQRPVGALVGALRDLGCEVECLDEEGFAPLAIRGDRFHGGSVQLEASESSQYASALMMAGARAVAPLLVELTRLVSGPYLELTVQALNEFGAAVEWDGRRRFRVEPGLRRDNRVRVEGDFSSACYFAAGAALVGGRVELYHLRRDSKQGDRRFFEILERMGCRVGWRDELLEVAGTGRLDAVDCDMSELPDQVPTLTALAPFARGVTRIRNVSHLRLKESDRLSGMANALRAAGAEVVEKPDGLEIPGIWAGGKPPGGAIVLDPLDDHRLAMSFAVLGLGRSGIAVGEPQVVAKSYPAFWSEFEARFAR